jgi:hypothetical protein
LTGSDADDAKVEVADLLSPKWREQGYAVAALRHRGVMRAGILDLIYHATPLRHSISFSIY